MATTSLAIPGQERVAWTKRFAPEVAPRSLQGQITTSPVRPIPTVSRYRAATLATYASFPAEPSRSPSSAAPTRGIWPTFPGRWRLPKWGWAVGVPRVVRGQVRLVAAANARPTYPRPTPPPSSPWTWASQRCCPSWCRCRCRCCSVLRTQARVLVGCQGKRDAAKIAIAGLPETRARFDRVADLVDGFETPWLPGRP